MARREELTDEQWARHRTLDSSHRRPDGKGRPWRDNPDVRNGILFCSADRGAVGRPAGEVSPIPDLPPSIPAMGRGTEPCAGSSLALAEELRQRGGWTSRNVSPMAPLWWRKEGARGGED